MTIKTRITFKEYMKLLLGLTYRKPILIFLLCFAAVMLVWILGYYLGFSQVQEPAYYQYLSVTLIVVAQPIMIYTTIWRNYYSSNHLREKLSIEFTAKELKITGESFYTEITWEKTYKIVEQTSWYLIYQNNLSAIILPKKSFNKTQEAELRAILQAVPKVPKHLKKE